LHLKSSLVVLPFARVGIPVGRATNGLLALGLLAGFAMLISLRLRLRLRLGRGLAA
jgi:hypothetical protein